MIALKKRLGELEAESDRYHDRMFDKAQAEFGLPLPPGSDVAEAMVRTLDVLRRIRLLPDGSDDRKVEIATEFRDWVLFEHERHKSS